MSMYSLSVSHILVKLVLMLVRFPESIFVLKIFVLLLFYSFTLIFGFVIILNKLLLDFAKHRNLKNRYLEIYKQYSKLSDDYQVCSGTIQNGQENTESNKNNNKMNKHLQKTTFFSVKRSNDQMNTNRKQIKELPSFVVPQVRSNKIDTLESSKQKLFMLRLKIEELQIKPLISSFPTVIKLFLFIMVILFFNNKYFPLSLLIFGIEIGNTLMILKLNTNKVTLLCCVKEVFLVLMFLFMFSARYFYGKVSLNHYFDALNLQYIFLFIVLSYLIQKSQQLPEVRDIKSIDSD